jgi:hypothetical protein
MLFLKDYLGFSVHVNPLPSTPILTKVVGKMVGKNVTFSPPKPILTLNGGQRSIRCSQPLE